MRWDFSREPQQGRDEAGMKTQAFGPQPPLLFPSPPNPTPSQNWREPRRPGFPDCRTLESSNPSFTRMQHRGQRQPLQLPSGEVGGRDVGVPPPTGESQGLRPRS